jgi:hypothetical protein
MNLQKISCFATGGGDFDIGLVLSADKFLQKSIPVFLFAGGSSMVTTLGSPIPSRNEGYASAGDSTGPAPYATAVFSFVQNGVTVTEAGVPASPPTTSARIFVDYRSGVDAIPARSEAGIVDVNTGIAVVNPGSADADITLTLRNLDGEILATGTGTLDEGKHFACFIDQLQDIAKTDFELPLDFRTAEQFGSLEIASEQPLSVLALRGTNNQRNDFILTTTPTADLTQALNDDPIYYPQFVDGGGYTSSLILLNTSDETETGTIEIMDDSGAPFVVQPVGQEAGSSFPYSIPPGGSFRMQTDGYPAEFTAGWVRLTPNPGTSTPVGSGVISYNPENMLVTESGVPAAASTNHARVYVDLSANHNTGIAIANISDSNADIEIHAYQNDGATEAGSSPGLLEMVPYGHAAKFANQFIDGLPDGFTGVLDISSASAFSALTLRSLNNERNDFLITTFPVADFTRSAPSPIVFPQIADGGGYGTQFIFISPGGLSNLTLNLYDEEGEPLAVGK